MWTRSLALVFVASVTFPSLLRAQASPPYSGKVFLGLSGDPVALSEDKRYASSFGLKLTRVAAGSSADQVGLQVGDIVVSIDGRAWTNEQIRLSRSFGPRGQKPKPGDTSQVVLLRGDSDADHAPMQLHEITMPLLRYPRTARERTGTPDNATLRPDLTGRRTASEDLCWHLIRAYGFETGSRNLLERLAACEQFPDPDRLAIVRYVHRDPFRLETVSREMTDNFLRRHRPGPADLSPVLDLARYVLVDFGRLPQGPAVGPATTPFLGQDLDAHLDYVAAVLQQCADAHREAFANVSAEQVEFLLEHRAGLIEAFLEHRMLSHDLDRPRQAANLRLLDVAGGLDVGALIRQTIHLCLLIDPVFLASLRQAVESSGMDLTDELLAERNTPHGMILVAGVGRNRHVEISPAVVFDLGGDDVYAGPQARSVWGSVPTALIVDYQGDDAYETHEPFNQGCGDLGVGMLVDLAGDDRYVGTRLTQAVGFLGIGVLVDQSGNDVYRGLELHQGVGHWGAGLLVDEAGEDRYDAHLLSQGVGLPAGFGLLCDRGGGGDAYYCKGQVPGGYGKPGVFGGWGQAMGIGYRPYASGGVGVIYDDGGGDHMEAGNFAQGGAYFYGFGLLYCGGSESDHYIGSRYAQGFTAHQAAGAMIEAGGDDRYTTRYAVATGISWDESVTLFLDEAGDDLYEGGSFSHGAAAMNGWSIFLDLAGRDTYRYTDQAGGTTNTYHGGTSLAFFVDAGGADDDYPSKPNNRVVGGGEHSIFVDLAGPLDQALEDDAIRVLEVPDRNRVSLPNE